MWSGERALAPALASGSESSIPCQPRPLVVDSGLWLASLMLMDRGGCGEGPMKIKCSKVEQITVFLENRPGVLADLCAYLSDRGINIRAMGVLDDPDTGTVRLIVDNPEPPKNVLADGVAYASASCLALEMPNNPGGFGGVARTLSLAGINIDAIYASALPGAATSLGIFRVSDLDRALSLDWGS